MKNMNVAPDVDVGEIARMVFLSFLVLARCAELF
jgi:hypothetical protein